MGVGGVFIYSFTCTPLLLRLFRFCSFLLLFKGTVLSYSLMGGNNRVFYLVEEEGPIEIGEKEKLSAFVP